MRVRLTQIDGKLPNLALMKLAHWHRAQGHEVVVTRHANRDLLEGAYDRVYGSAIFSASAPAVDRFRADFPGAVLGGTGIQGGNGVTVEDVIGQSWEHYDYSDWPEYGASLGFTQRGCRLKCKFCVVPNKEGDPVSVNTIGGIWRGEGHPRQIHLLDNDFFGQAPDQWLARLKEIRDGGFQVCFNQGINVRKIDAETAAAIGEYLIVKRTAKSGREIRHYLYRDDSFAKPRLYTAWDNLKDEDVFFRGVEELAKAGVPPKHLMAYMLVGFDKSETEARMMHRFERMDDLGIMVYPMPFDGARGALPLTELRRFQRWVVNRRVSWKNRVTGTRKIPFAEFENGRKNAVINARAARLIAEPALI